MKGKFFKPLVLFVINFPAVCISSSEPLEYTGSFAPDWLYEFPPAAFSAGSSPDVLFVEDGGGYWLYNVETNDNRLITKDAPGLDGYSFGLYWGSDQIMVLYPSDQVDNRVPVEILGGLQVNKFGIDGASLKISKWLDSEDILISDTVPYVLKDRKFAPPEDHDYSYHTPTQSGLVVIDDQRYVTSGYEDQSLEIRSLPDGRLLNRWVLGKWYSSRRITHIAVVDNRLIVASDGGRIEERSLETGEVLWSIRPCRGGGAYFRHSSQFQHMGKVPSPPLESINIDGDIYYTCGAKFGRIGRDGGEWRHDVLLTKKQLSGPVSTVETLPHTVLSVLVLHEGDVLVVDREKRAVVQTLPKTREWHPNAVTYIAATHQLLTVGEDGTIHLFAVPDDRRSGSLSEL